MRTLVVFAALAALVVPASAEDWAKSTGSWHVFDRGATCAASNRPPLEVRFSPYNTLLVAVTKTEEMAPIQVNFWPGAFVEGADLALTFQPAARDMHTPAPEAVTLAATAVSDHELRSRDAMPESLIEAMARGPSVSVSAEGVDQKLVFDVADLMDAGELLEDCIGRNP